MRFNFILPNFARVPSGGTKIMYEYANKLAEEGNDVYIYNNLQTPNLKYSFFKPFVVRKLISFFFDKDRPYPKWISLNENIKCYFINKISNENIRDAEIIMFTWWSLAGPISHLSAKKGKKINLIQDYEIWFGNEDKVHESYKFPNILNIAISKYIQEIVEKFAPNCFYIPNAINENLFLEKIPINTRKKHTFLMLYSTEPRKASHVGLVAFEKLKQLHSEIELTLFGVNERPKDLPSWIKYEKNPKNIFDLYNKNRVFISNSKFEGWGLPIHEAMASGCAVICTDIAGHLHFIENNKYIFTYKAENADELLLQLLLVYNTDEDQFKEISENNKIQVKNFTWENSIISINKIITKIQ